MRADRDRARGMRARHWMGAIGLIAGLGAGAGASAAMADNAHRSQVAQIDPDFDDPHACSAMNKRARDLSVGFLKSKLSDPDLVAAMTPAHPVW